MMKLSTNQHIKKLLESTPKLFPEQSLTLGQIEWRIINTRSVMGLLGKTRFGKIKQMFLIEKADGGYMLLAPANRKDSAPNYLYDILDIAEFVKRFPIRVFYFGDERDSELDSLYDDFQDIKDKQAKGFIDTSDSQETFIYELV